MIRPVRVRWRRFPEREVLRCTAWLDDGRQFSCERRVKSLDVEPLVMAILIEEMADVGILISEAP